ncbi:MAG: folate-binding protein [Pseudomonadota bacterium]
MRPMTEKQDQYYAMPDRAVVAINGDDASTFLQGLLTQDVASEDTNPNEAAFAALLTPQGKILFDFFLVRTDTGFMVDVAADVTDAFVKRLKLYKLRAKVIIERRDDLAVGWRKTPVAVEADNINADPGTVHMFNDPRTERLGARTIAAKETLSDLNDLDAYESLRLHEGVPEFLKDFEADSVFLMDVNYDALHGVDYKKGCFVGQEVASRMKRKGAVRKRTYKLMTESRPLAKGASIMAGEKTIGEISSALENRALARVRTDRLQAASEPLTVEGNTVTVTPPDYLSETDT